MKKNANPAGRVVLITGHVFESKRKANFHWLAESFWAAGWEVIFFTAWISWISWFCRDPRFQCFKLRDRRKVVWLRERLANYIWMTAWHPILFRLPWMNNLTVAPFRRYGKLSLGKAEKFLPSTDLFIFESTPGLMLFEKFKKITPNAKFVYRASDPLKLVSIHPVVEEAETRHAGDFDLISTTSNYSFKQFKHFPTAKLHGHGLKKELFDQTYESPYAPGSFNVVWVGNSHFDMMFLETAARRFEDWSFHIIGPISGVKSLSNIKAYGEMPFLQTIKYIQHADIGLQTRSYMAGAEHLTDTLKVLQYAYCGLPVVAPEFLRNTRSNTFYYEPGNSESIRAAMEAASSYGRSDIEKQSIPSWDDIRDRILESVGF